MSVVTTCAVTVFRNHAEAEPSSVGAEDDDTTNEESVFEGTLEQCDDAKKRHERRRLHERL